MLTARKRRRSRVTTPRSAERTRGRLLQAAFHEIYRSGFRTADLDAILATAGVTKGAPYHHFGSKDALGYAVVDEVHDCLGPCEEESNEPKHGQDDRIRNLRAGGRAGRGVASAGRRRQDTVSQNGPARPVPDGGPSRRDSHGTERSSGGNIRRCENSDPRTAWLRNRSRREERFRVCRRAIMDGSF